MNVKQCKILRKEIYGDQSLKQERQYANLGSGQVVNTGLRIQYQLDKRSYKKVKRGF